MSTDTSRSRLEILAELDANPLVDRIQIIRHAWLRAGLRWLEMQGYVVQGESSLRQLRYTITPEGRTRLNEHREGFTLPGSTTTKG